MPLANSRWRSAMASFFPGQSRLNTGNAGSPIGSTAASNLAFTNAVLRRSRLAKAGRVRSNPSYARVALAKPAGNELLPVTLLFPSSTPPPYQPRPKNAPPNLPRPFLGSI